MKTRESNDQLRQYQTGTKTILDDMFLNLSDLHFKNRRGPVW